MVSAPRYARIQNGVVVQVWDAPAGFTPAEAFESSIAAEFHPTPVEADVEPDWVLVDGVFAPPPPVVRIAPVSLGFGDFMDLMTADEQATVVAAAQTNPRVMLWYDRVRADGRVDRTSPLAQAAFDALAEAGALSAERARAVLAGEVP